MYKLLAFSALFAAAIAVNPGYPQPHGKGYAEQYPDVDPQYKYGYAVKDDYSGANFAQSEQRDGYNTQGSYQVLLPDGRLQTVNYYDNGDGNVAQVSYEGQARYDDHRPSKGHAASSYKPIYAPAPHAPSYAPKRPAYAPRTYAPHH